LFDTWLAKRPDLPRLAAPATSGFYDDIFGMPRTPISEPGLDWRPSRAPVIASGGISSLQDIKDLQDLVPLGLEGAILGKSLYAGRFSLQEALAIANG
jgi:hypothetical protein